MKQFEVIKYNNQSIELDVSVSSDCSTLWLTKEQMALLFNRNRTVVLKHIQRIYDDHELEKGATCANNAHVRSEGKRSVIRDIECFNLDMILAVGRRIKSQNGILLKLWFEELISSKNREIIVYNNGEVRLDVQIEPMKETVWLSVVQMSKLFETSTDNIYLHIKNIYEEGELYASVTEESSTTEKVVLLTAKDGKSYPTTLYNLDMILAVGYRVKGKRAIEFRRWVSSVLKQYLLKGYAIDKERSLVTNENFLHLVNEVNHLKDDVEGIKEFLYSKVSHSFVCYEGQYYDGFRFVNDLICSAKKRVIIIDGYADFSVLDFFVGSKKGVRKTIVCHKIDRIDDSTLERFSKQYGEIAIKEDKTYHDRFLIIDDDIYLLGTSLNSLGNKTSTITKTDQYNIAEIYQDE